ncbi:cellulose binding domain-containing protein [Micromonospora okii]|uniref:cellulose binding domain-containing protein n=1 Tax=Micromonospora okii TaxID=1182970 RepID=UPI001E28C1C6|nr:cellulose binding domain-containing protein [Micromonospora okii]
MRHAIPPSESPRPTGERSPRPAAEPPPRARRARPRPRRLLAAGAALVAGLALTVAVPHLAPASAAPAVNLMPPENVPPTVPGTPVASGVTPTGLTLTWAASTDTGGSGLAGYEITQETVGSDALNLHRSLTNTLTLTSLAPARNYRFWVRARDHASNTSASSPVLAVATPAGTGPDVIGPTPPGAPTASAVGPNGATLTWGPSTDDVGVVGYQVYRTSWPVHSVVDTVAGTSHAVTGLSPATTYAFYVIAFDAAGNPSTPSPVVTVTTTGTPTPTPSPTLPPPTCRVAYATSDWGTGFSANITVTNTGPTALGAWTLAFTFPDVGQKVAHGWSATITQIGTAVRASNVSYNGTLAPGASTGFGFTGTHTGATPRPGTFTLNGVPCITV